MNKDYFLSAANYVGFNLIIYMGIVVVFSYPLTIQGMISNAIFSMVLHRLLLYRPQDQSDQE